MRQQTELKNPIIMRQNFSFPSSIMAAYYARIQSQRKHANVILDIKGENYRKNK